MPESTKEKLRKWNISRIEKQYNLPLHSLCPSIGKYEPFILDYLESIWNYKIQRQKRVAGYFLDGYCPMLNLAIEIDEPYHRSKEQLKKDNYREEQIKNEIGCSFLRIDVGD